LTNSFSQSKAIDSLNIGQTPPTLHNVTWLQGDSVTRFERGNIYVVEFWATWCIPCKSVVPILNHLSRQYKKNGVTIIGFNVFEKQSNRIEDLMRFLDTAMPKVRYSVAKADNNIMEKEWLLAAGEEAIPHAFIINRNGEIAWIGHPGDIKDVLEKVVHNAWDVEAALHKRQLQKRISEMDNSWNTKLLDYAGSMRINFWGDPDSTLYAIGKATQDHPELKFAPLMTYNTFSALLKLDLSRALNFGQEAITNNLFGADNAGKIIDAIEWYSDKITLSPEIYRLGARSLEIKFANMRIRNLSDTFQTYNKMSSWYWLARDPKLSLRAQKRAIKALKRSRKS